MLEQRAYAIEDLVLLKQRDGVGLLVEDGARDDFAAKVKVQDIRLLAHDGDHELVRGLIDLAGRSRQHDLELQRRCVIHRAHDDTKVRDAGFLTSAKPSMTSDELEGARLRRVRTRQARHDLAHLADRCGELIDPVERLPRVVRILLQLRERNDAVVGAGIVFRRVLLRGSSLRAVAVGLRHGAPRCLLAERFASPASRGLKRGRESCR